MILPFRKPSFGLDLGGRSLKGVQLYIKSGRVCLGKYIYYDFVDDQNFPQIQATHQRLRALVETQELQKFNVYSALKDIEVSRFNLELPVGLPAKEVPAALSNMLAEALNYPLEEAVYDFWPEKPASAKALELRYQSFAAPKEKVNERLELLKTANLEPSSIESEMLAYLAMIKFNKYLADTTIASSYLVLDVGETHTSVAWVVEDEIQNISSWPNGARTITTKISAALNISYKAADTFKNDPTSWRQFGEKGPAARAELKAALRSFLDELQRITDSFVELAIQNPIKKLFMVGGGCRVRAFSAILSKHLGFSAEVVNPFRNIQIYGEHNATDNQIGKLSEVMGLAVGLALRDIKYDH